MMLSRHKQIDHKKLPKYYFNKLAVHCIDDCVYFYHRKTFATTLENSFSELNSESEKKDKSLDQMDSKVCPCQDIHYYASE